MKHLQIAFFTVALTATTVFALDWKNADSVVKAALEVNPSLAVLSAQIRASQERVVTAGSLPNPMLMGGVENEPVNLSYDFMTMYTVGLSQTLVRKPRRDALRRAADLDFERLRHEYEGRRAEVERDVRTTYIEAAAAENQMAATEEISRLLTSVTSASRIRYETGAVPQADLIRAMLEQTTVDHQLIALRRQRRVALARLLPLLRLPSNTPVPAFSLPQEMEHGHDHGFDVALPDSTPAIGTLQSEVAGAEEEIRLARLTTKPDISIEASYGFRPRDVDMVSVVARIELPVRRSSLIEPRIREAVARREAALQQIDVLRQQLQADLGAAVALRSEAIEQINLHVDKLVPAAKLGFESSLASYESGKSSFDAVLGSLRTYVALNVDYYDFLRQQMEAEVDIDAIRRGARGGISGSGSMTSPPMSSSPASTSTPSGSAMQ